MLAVWRGENGGGRWAQGGRISYLLAPDHVAEFGFAASLSHPFQSDQSRQDASFDYQTWGGAHFKYVDVGCLVGLGANSRFVGGFARLNALTSDEVRLGLQVGVGIVGAHIALPVAFRMAEDMWIYTAPTAAASVVRLRLPVGVGYHIHDFITILAEGSLGIGAAFFGSTQLECASGGSSSCLSATFSLGLSFHPGSPPTRVPVRKTLP